MPCAAHTRMMVGGLARRELLPFETAIGTFPARQRKGRGVVVTAYTPGRRIPPLPAALVAGRYHPAPLVPLRSRASCPVFMAAIHITDIEAAINHWRHRAPASPDGLGLAPEVQALGEVYALMVYEHTTEIDEDSLPSAAMAAWQAWYDTTPDTPCIAICSTSQGDDLCKGCGRTFDEVQFWPSYTPAEKRGVWRRITLEHSAWRFNRYAERAAEGVTAPGAPTAG
eukprot:gene124-124_t